MTNSFVHFYFSGTDECEPFKSPGELASEGWFCESCFGFRAGAGAVDIRIKERRIPSSPLASVRGTRVTLARQSFLDLFGKDRVGRDLMIGAVLGPDGSPIDDWVTWRAHRRVVIRRKNGLGYTGAGHQYIGWRRCAECGRLIYHALGAAYLSPAPDPDRDLFESHLTGLVVRSDLAEVITIPRRKGVGLERLKILDPAPDGFGNFDGGEQ